MRSLPLPSLHRLLAAWREGGGGSIASFRNPRHSNLQQSGYTRLTACKRIGMCSKPSLLLVIPQAAELWEWHHSLGIWLLIAKMTGLHHDLCPAAMTNACGCRSLIWESNGITDGGDVRYPSILKSGSTQLTHLRLSVREFAWDKASQEAFAGLHGLKELSLCNRAGLEKLIVSSAAQITKLELVVDLVRSMLPQAHCDMLC